MFNVNNEDNGNINEQNFIVKICAFIVDKRNLFFLIFALGTIFSVFSKSWVNVENSLSYYLPQSTETKQGLDLMEEEFVTYGSCTFMVANVSYEQAEHLAEDIRNIDGVFSLDFDNTSDYYVNASAKFDVTFNYDENDKICLTLQDEIEDYLSEYDYFLKTSLGDVSAELINEEMKTISVVVVFIVLGVLLFATEAYLQRRISRGAPPLM